MNASIRLFIYSIKMHRESALCLSLNYAHKVEMGRKISSNPQDFKSGKGNGQINQVVFTMG